MKQVVIGTGLLVCMLMVIISCKAPPTESQSKKVSIPPATTQRTASDSKGRFNLIELASDEVNQLQVVGEGNQWTKIGSDGVPKALKFWFRIGNPTQHLVAGIRVRATIEFRGSSKTFSAEKDCTKYVNSPYFLVANAIPANFVCDPIEIEIPVTPDAWRSDMRVTGKATTALRITPGKNIIDETALFGLLEVASTKEIVDRMKAEPAIEKLSFRDGSNILHGAVFCEKMDLVDTLIKDGIDPKNKNSNGYTLLHRSALTTPEMVQKVAKLGIAPNAIDHLGRTALFHASASENTPVFEALIKAGCSLEHKDKGGLTPLMVAVLNSASESAIELKRLGANLNCRTENGFGVMAAALWQRKVISVVDSYLKNGLGKIDEETRDGRNLPILAVQTSQYDAFQWLTQNGANFKHKDKSGKSAIDYAKMIPHPTDRENTLRAMEAAGVDVR